MLYYAAGWFGRHRYRGYRHHKSFSPWYEMRCWVRAGRRKLWYRWKQRHMLSHITETLDNAYYGDFAGLQRQPDYSPQPV